MLPHSSNQALSKRGKNKARRVFGGIFQVLKRSPPSPPPPPPVPPLPRPVADLQLVLSQSLSRQLMFHFQRIKQLLLQVEHKLSLSVCVLLRGGVREEGGGGVAVRSLAALPC